MTAPLEKQKEEIRAACIKANPEIVELKFGCRVEYDTEIYEYLGVEPIANGQFHRIHHRTRDYPVTVRGVNIVKERDLKVIGRPIRLADVLLAIDKVPLPKHFVFLPSGNIYMFESGVLGTPVATWNLLKSFEDQEPETIAFIHSLIV